MGRLIRRPARLYTPWWRRRYAAEFEALIDNLEPGLRTLFDVVRGALTMQMRTLRAVPIACALAGAIVGGFVATRTPAIYASSAIIRIDARDVAHAEGSGQEHGGDTDRRSGRAKR
jgi:hypothetical protein